MPLFTRLTNALISNLASLIGSILYHLNDLLHGTAQFFRSHTLLNLANSYGAWYNGYLLSNILREGGVLGSILDQELRGTIMIVTFRSRGHFSPHKCRTVLAAYLGVQTIQIQVNKKGSSLYSIVFPIR